MEDIYVEQNFKDYLLTEVGNFHAQPGHDNFLDISIFAWGDDADGKFWNETLFNEVIYGSSSDIIVYDLQEMIRDFMKAHHIVYASVGVGVSGYDDTEFGVVYQETEKARTLEDLSKTFLVSSPVKIFFGLPQGEKIYSLGTVKEGSADIIAVVSAESESMGRFTFNEVFRRTFTSNYKLMSLEPNLNAILEDARQINQDTTRIISISFSQNDRSLLWIFDYESVNAPHNCFCFINNYGVLESLWMKGVTTEKIKTSRSLTVSSYHRVAYDNTAERSFKFTTGAMTKSMERTFREFMTSQEFYLYVAGVVTKAVTESVEFETDDNIKEVNNAEFEFCLVKMNDFGEVRGDHSRIFNDTYNFVYG